MRFKFLMAFLVMMVPLLAPLTSHADEKAEPSLEQRVMDLEAYVNNGARGSDAADAAILHSLLPTLRLDSLLSLLDLAVCFGELHQDD